MTERFSPSRVATYLTCPRQFEYQYRHDLDGAAQPEMERYFDRGSVLDTALQRTADTVSTDTPTEQVQELAVEHFDEEWTATTSQANYASPAAYRYDRRISRAAIKDYVDPQTGGAGVTHLQRSVGTELHFEWTDSELGALHGYADNVVRTDDGFLIIDYKASYSGRRFPNKSGSDLDKQLDGTRHHPSRLKKWLQLGMYCAGLKAHDLYSPGDEIQFMFYGLIGSKSRTPTADDYTVSVSGKAWDMTELYRDYEEPLWSFISDSIAGIQAEEFSPTGERWDLIQEEACGSCEYQAACGDYLAEEVRFS